MNVLATILDHKRAEVQAQKQSLTGKLEPPPNLPKLDFLSALREPGVSVIAEIKRKSPSSGSIRQNVDVPAIATSYRRGGAAALSVLTDERFFGAARNDLTDAKSAASLPVLRKDFIIDAYQIHESIHLGADAVLLIVAVLTDSQLEEFVGLAHELGLQALVEAHSESELERAIHCGATIIGVNSRDLTTMKVYLDVCTGLRRHIPANCVAVAESGVRSRDDFLRLADAGYDAILIGEALMAAADPTRRLRELTGRPSRLQEAGGTVDPVERGA